MLVLFDLVTLMFLGLFLYAARWFLSTFPVIQIWQPMVDPEVFDREAPPEVPREGASVG